jgi:hypothetical protein
VYRYFENNPIDAETERIYFVNDTDAPTAAWGSSRQIKHALMGDEFFKVLYGAEAPAILYEDDRSLSAEAATQSGTLVLQSSRFKRSSY